MKQDTYTRWALWIIILSLVLRIILALLTTPSGDGCWHASVARFIGEEGRLPTFELAAKLYNLGVRGQALPDAARPGAN